MVGALFDTNIFVDYLKGISAARDELALHSKHAISIITWMEVLVGARDAEPATRRFLERFETISIDGAVALRAVELRRDHRIKLPDAIVWATAQAHSLPLVTRNTKDFPTSHPGIRVPYPTP